MSLVELKLAKALNSSLPTEKREAWQRNSSHKHSHHLNNRAPFKIVNI